MVKFLCAECGAKKSPQEVTVVTQSRKPQVICRDHLPEAVPVTLDELKAVQKPIEEDPPSLSRFRNFQFVET